MEGSELSPSDLVEGLSPKGARMPGDVILGGLFPVHEKSERCEAASSPPALPSHYICCRFDLPCGEQLYDRGLQRLEAMLYAVDRFNISDKISFIHLPLLFFYFIKSTCMTRFNILYKFYF